MANSINSIARPWRRRKLMENIGSLPGERLAGLWADLAHKIQKQKISLDELALFNQRKDPFEVKVEEKLPLFDHVTNLNFPGMSAFNTDDFFTTETPKGSTVKFSSIGENFKECFGNMEVLATQPTELSLDRLRGNSYDPDITKEIGEENCDQSLAVIRWHLESGWAKDNPWYAGYFIDKNGLRRGVHWNWDGDGWHVHALEVPLPYRWAEGRRFVSRRPSAT